LLVFHKEGATHKTSVLQEKQIKRVLKNLSSLLQMKYLSYQIDKDNIIFIAQGFFNR